MYLNYKKQRGSALVIAVFVIVVMLALAVGLSRLLISSSETVVYEVQGTRALFAAQSGLEIVLSELLFSETRSCESFSRDTPLTFSISAGGQSNCPVTVSCEDYTAENVTIYQLESIGQCIANDFTTSRTVQIEVRK